MDWKKSIALAKIKLVLNNLEHSKIKRPLTINGKCECVTELFYQLHSRWNYLMFENTNFLWKCFFFFEISFNSRQKVFEFRLHSLFVATIYCRVFVVVFVVFVFLRLISIKKIWQVFAVDTFQHASVGLSIGRMAMQCIAPRRVTGVIGLRKQTQSPRSSSRWCNRGRGTTKWRSVLSVAKFRFFCYTTFSVLQQCTTNSFSLFLSLTYLLAVFVYKSKDYYFLDFIFFYFFL